MIATSRVARQTSRWARFAVVTVEVTAAVTDTVTVGHGVHGNEATRQEAVYGAREALRHVPPSRGSHQVSVTEIVTTEVDTGVGDVYETTARAVHQALSIDSPPVVGLSEPKLVAGWLRDRIGRRLAEVTEARHCYHGERSSDTAAGLIHAWLRFDHRPPTRLHGCADNLQLSTNDPYPGYNMDQFGEVRVAPASAPDLLASVVGRQLTDAAVIVGPFDEPVCAGLLLRLDGVGVVIGTFGDEWILAFDQPPTHVAPYWRRQPWLAQG